MSTTQKSYAAILGTKDVKPEPPKQEKKETGPILKEVKKRTCKGTTALHFFTGPAYRCEDCLSYKCSDCLIKDEEQDEPNGKGTAWENRLRDGVFLCKRCYNTNLRGEELY